MIKNRIFSYKRIVVLTLSRLEELKTILLKHCDRIKYKAYTKNDAEIIFDSFDELKNFNNFGDDKIVALNLNCRVKNDYDFLINIDFSPKYHFPDDTVRCTYCFSDVDKESVFISDFKKFLDKITIYHTKYMICEWASYVFFLVLGLYPIFIPINGTAYYQTVKGTYPFLSSILVFEIIAIGLNKLCSHFVWKKLFPRAIYAWGEESENYSRLEKLRSNLFWCVLVAALVSIVIGFILK